MFVIHIASCLVDKNRTKYLYNLIKHLTNAFPTTRVYIGFDIIGIEHENGKDLLPLLQNNDMITCFTHTNGLGYSWNHPWDLHDHDLALQIEDDWDISNLNTLHVSLISDTLKNNNSPSLIVFKKPDGALADIIKENKDSLCIVDMNKFQGDKHFHLFSNHPHFETRSFRSVIGKHPENVPPPDVEVTFVRTCIELKTGFITYSICQGYAHTGAQSVNYGLSWTSQIVRIDHRYNADTIKKQIGDKLSDYDLVYVDDKVNIYDVLRGITKKSILILFPNIYMIQTYRLNKIIPFVSVFFNRCLVITNNHTILAKDYVNGSESKTYYPIVEKLGENMLVLKKL